MGSPSGLNITKARRSVRVSIPKLLGISRLLQFRSEPHRARSTAPKTKPRGICGKPGQVKYLSQTYTQAITVLAAVTRRP
ncbi:hypothetical protein GCM10027589_22330 [Actinocorallia lasiicapitis]